MYGLSNWGKMNMTLKYSKELLILFVCGLFILTTENTQAQGQDNAFQRCLSIEDNQARLSCFDQAARAMNNQETISPPITTPHTQPNAIIAPAQVTSIQPDTQPDAARRDEFGRSSMRPEPTEVEDDTLHVTIVSWRKSLRGHYIMTTADGQVWRQTETGRIPLRGDQVSATIKKGALGSFRLNIDGMRKSFRVKRER